jgi:hypothetical protein
MNMERRKTESTQLQDEMKALAQLVIPRLNRTPEDRQRLQRRLDVWIPGLVAEMGPHGVTPRHTGERTGMLAMQVCHVFPLHLTMTETTIKGAFERGLIFPAGVIANACDGKSCSIFSINHTVIGWTVLQLKHMVINHLWGVGQQIESLSNAKAPESKEGRRKRQVLTRNSEGAAAAGEIIETAVAELLAKPVADRAIEKLTASLMVTYVYMCQGKVRKWHLLGV